MKHKMISERIGDWVYHRCPDCSQEIHDNLKTDEVLFINTTEHEHKAEYHEMDQRKAH